MAQAQAIGKEFTFVWEGTDKKGQRVKGQSVGPNERMIKNQTRQQGLNPPKGRKQTRLFCSGKHGPKKEAGGISTFYRPM